ncbi:MAG: exodeoxyribonuclease VII small subunit [Ruminococcus sp.]|nr:exodeoxyribonuclease VII small subunit [Ruminococcus sp.]
MKDKATFEENMDQLGKIVSELEKGNIPLEKAVELYGEGVKLSAVCKKQLDEAHIKITEDDADKVSDKHNE